jgi:galactokinase
MKELALKVTQDFLFRFNDQPQVFSQAPGRINIIGEHTDYTGGYSLPAAIDCWTLGAWKKRDDSLIKIHSSNMEEFWETSWELLENSLDESWKKYVAGAILLFKKSQLTDGADQKGFNLSLDGNIPLGKGLSSSASVELAVLNGLNFLYKKNLSPLELAKMAQQVEHQYLKVKSGLLDQFACQFSKKDEALLIDFSSLKTQAVPLDPVFADYSWVLVDSLVKRELSNSKYSERVEEYGKIKSILAEKGKGTLRDITYSEVSPLFAEAGENIVMRARHIVSENERTLDACACLKNGKVRTLGELLLQTHVSLSFDYEVSHPHLDFLVARGKDLPGVVGGRMMGGGFGGCVLFLVKTSEVENFSAEIAEQYFVHSGLATEPRIYRFVSGASAWTAHGH